MYKRNIIFILLIMFFILGCAREMVVQTEVSSGEVSVDTPLDFDINELNDTDELDESELSALDQDLTDLENL